MNTTAYLIKDAEHKVNSDTLEVYTGLGFKWNVGKFNGYMEFVLGLHPISNNFFKQFESKQTCELLLYDSPEYLDTYANITIVFDFTENVFRIYKTDDKGYGEHPFELTDQVIETILELKKLKQQGLLF